MKMLTLNKKNKKKCVYKKSIIIEALNKCGWRIFGLFSHHFLLRAFSSFVTHLFKSTYHQILEKALIDLCTKYADFQYSVKSYDNKVQKCTKRQFTILFGQFLADLANLHQISTDLGNF